MAKVWREEPSTTNPKRKRGELQKGHQLRSSKKWNVRSASLSLGLGLVLRLIAGQLSGSYPNSRSSCEQRQAFAIIAAQWMAASRDGSSRTQKPPSNSLVSG